MTKVQDSIKDFEKTQETLKKSPEDGEANAKLANLMAMRGKQKEAEAAIGKAEKAKYGGEPLAEAYNGVGDLYQSAGEFDKAIEYFRKADAASKEMSTRGYALASIMTCHQQAGQTDKAKAVAKKLVEMKDMPKEYVDGAKALLEQQP
jgi:tetratricopeptide (TPR) repeat protein